MNNFSLGSIVCTRAIFDTMNKDYDFSEFAKASLARHSAGDWGDMCEGDKQANEAALVDGSRLFSAYKADGRPKIWIITEANRSATTILFPYEY